MYYLNKIVAVIVNPVYLGLAGCLLGFVLTVCRRRKAARRLFAGSLLWIAFWSLPIVSRLIGASLERPYLVNGRVPTIESYPTADAIELHGGSMGIETNLSDYAEMWIGADRVWHAARLWKAGKAPIIYVTGGGVKLTTAGLLKDFGVPTNAVVFAEEPRNTEEEARFIGEAMKQVQSSESVSSSEFRVQSSESVLSSEFRVERDVENSKLQTLNIKLERPKVLVVTSAWHMKRAMLMYEKFAPNVEAIPAPCDFEGSMGDVAPIGMLDFIPNPLSLFGNFVSIHEWIGIWGYKLFR